MDPLSVTAAAVSFLAFAGISAEGFQRIVRDARNAPEEILAISNEINDLMVVATNVEMVCSELPRTTDLQHSVASTLKSIDYYLSIANSKIQRSVILKDQICFQLPDGTRRINRISWVRNKSVFLTLVKDLKELKNNLNFMLVTMTLYVKAAAMAIR